MLDAARYKICFWNFHTFAIHTHLGTQQLVEAIEKEKSENKKRIKTLEGNIAEEMSKDKKELIGKIETGEADIKKKVEMEANETRYVRWFTTFLNFKVDLPRDTWKYFQVSLTYHTLIIVSINGVRIL